MGIKKWLKQKQKPMDNNDGLEDSDSKKNGKSKTKDTKRAPLKALKNMKLPNFGSVGKDGGKLQSNLEEQTESRQTNDTYGQLKNVEALINAYKKGDLHWNPGYVTYWFKGRQICKPRPLDWNEAAYVYRHCCGLRKQHNSFWVEGVSTYLDIETALKKFLYIC